MKKFLLISLCIFAFAGIAFADVSINNVNKYEHLLVLEQNKSNSLTPAENEDNDYLKEYFSYVIRKTKANWNIPKGHEDKQVTLLYTIAKNGDLLDVKVIKSSGSDKADKAAINAVKKSAPFNPLPEEYTGNKLEIQYTFGYNILGKKKVR